MLEQIIKNTEAFLNAVTRTERKKYGQFFTSELSAIYMASMFKINLETDCIRLLDAGAGSGILSVALIERIRNMGYQGEIILTCFENDHKIIPLLAENLKALDKEYRVTYHLRTENYITSQQFNLQPVLVMDSEAYDYIIGNPPYMKLGKDAKEVQVMNEICHGAPNMYFLFMAMGINSLNWEGELVYIVPRSWTSGAYFEAFRKYLFNNCVIEQIHLFESRDKVFNSEPILQETMIIKVKNSKVKPKKILITSSSTSDFDKVSAYYADYDTVVGKDGYVYLITDEKQELVLKRVNKLTCTLPSINLKMSTGLIVDFRLKEELRDQYEEGACPLFYSSHIKNGTVVWPQGRPGEYILTSKRAHLQKNTNYLFVKRLTSKEEHRRLQCGIYLSKHYPEYRHISTQNKVNFIMCESEEVVYGLYALFTSTLYDNYYRLLNGSTQVNSTEVNSIPVPSKEIIREMGRELMNTEINETNCNLITDKWIK